MCRGRARRAEGEASEASLSGADFLIQCEPVHTTRLGPAANDRPDAADQVPKRGLVMACGAISAAHLRRRSRTIREPVGITPARAAASVHRWSRGRLGGDAPGSRRLTILQGTAANLGMARFRRDD